MVSVFLNGYETEIFTLNSIVSSTQWPITYHQFIFLFLIDMVFGPCESFMVVLIEWKPNDDFHIECQYGELSITCQNHKLISQLDDRLGFTH